MKRLDDLLGAESAPKTTGAAGSRPQARAFHEQRILRLHLLGGTVVGVTTVQRDGGALSATVMLRAPAAADQTAEVDIEAVILRAPPVDAPHHEVGMVTG